MPTCHTLLLRAVGVAVLACAAVPQGAAAHTALVRAHPQPGAALPSAPRSVQLRFTEAVDAGLATIRVQDAEGRRVDRGGVFHPRGREAVLAVRVARGTRGPLAVGWRAVSDDGHPLAGTLAFRVAAREPAAAPMAHGAHTAPGAHGAHTVTAAPAAAAAPVPELRAESPVTAALGAVARGAHALAVAIALGVVLFLLFAWPARRDPGEARRRLEAATTRLVAAVAVAGLPLALAGAWLEGAAIAGTGPLDVRAAGTALTALDGRAGCGWGLATVGWTLLLWRLARTRALRTDWPTLAAVSLVVAAPVLCGHADGLVLSAATVHVLAVAAWIGGLPALLLAGRAIRRSGLSGPEAGRVASRAAGGFSRLALPAALAVVGTGTIQSLVRLAAPMELLSTAYGRLLLVKIAAVALLLALGAANRARILPRLQGATAGSAGALLGRTVAAELVIAVGIFAATGLLTGSAPPT